VHFLWSAITPISGFSLELSLAAFGGIGFCPSVREGQKDNNKNLSILFIVLAPLNLSFYLTGV